MEQPFSTSKVTVEYFDPHGVFKLLAPGLVPRLPLRNLHWQSHAGPLRSIDTLHIELVATGEQTSSNLTSPLSSPPPLSRSNSSATATRDDGFQTQIGATLSTDTVDQPANRNSLPTRRHQIPGLRRTPYLKVLLVRCDDNDSYKGHVRQEIRDWIKANTPPSSSKKLNNAENHDAFEWLILHVVIPNTIAATQPRIGKSDSVEKPTAASRWRPGSSTLLEKLRSDFNSSSKSAPDRIAQIRIGVNDVPYDILPRVVPAVPSGYTETEQETDNSWTDLISKFRSLILSSFDLRVTQYEEDIKEKDAQRNLPGWNFCTFFILKEGLARGFESVGLVEDALVGYDELSIGLDMIIKERAAGDSGSAANALLNYTEELKQIAWKARADISGVAFEGEDEVVDMQSAQSAAAQPQESYDDIPISSSKKPYRDMIVANNVSIFDFRCYIFARQIALLLRLGNAWSTREELLAKLKEQQDSVLHGVAPRAPPPKQKENEHEDLSMLAEICRRTLEFIPSVSQVMRRDVLSALQDMSTSGDDTSLEASADPFAREVIDNLVASFAFSIAQQVLAQTSTKALPIPPSTLAPPGDQEPKAAIPEPKTMMHPARSSSLRVQTGGAGVGRPPPSPNIFPGRRMSTQDPEGPQSTFWKAGLEELAARRAELYALSRNILEECGKKRNWSDGWANVPILGQSSMIDMVEIDLNADDTTRDHEEGKSTGREPVISLAGVGSRLLKTALDNSDDFYRLYETLTDKALRHYTVATHTHSVQASMADLAVLKHHLGDYASAASYFWRTTPFFGESGWSLLELSMLVMYSSCLKRLQRKDEYVKVMLKLLSKASAAERDRQQRKASFKIGRSDAAEYPENEAIKGFLGDLIQEAKTLPNELRLPLSNFVSSVETDGIPRYPEERDSVLVDFKIQSLLVDDLKVDSVSVRMINAVAQAQRDILLELESPYNVRPGKNKLTLTSNSAIPGSYEIDRIDIKASNLSLYYEREIGQPVSKVSDDLVRSPYVFIYHRADTLDVRLHASNQFQLDRNNAVDIELHSGWNDILSAEVRVKAATGGLRLLTSEAMSVRSNIDFSKPPEGGLFCFGSIPRDMSLRIRFPYTVEQDAPSISIRIEVSYKTDNGTFFFSKTPTIHTALALGVNVQDLFKHTALFSRFTVSTASPSPLRLLKSELLASDVFESHFGAPFSGPITIFPRQPASLLYKITRKPGVNVTPKTQKIMYLQLRYSVLQEEVEALIEESLTQALIDTPLRPYSRLVVSTVLPHVQNDLSGHDLERAALLGSLSTAFLSSINWPRSFAALGPEISQNLTSFLQAWQTNHPKLKFSSLSKKYGEEDAGRSILIPVDIPSVTIVHTADIQLQPQPSSSSSSSAASALLIPPSLPADTVTPTAYTNQLIPATLHLKWTRIWDTATQPSDRADLEFSYEVTAPQDTWLLGGRRKGHFVIPASPTGTSSDSSSSSTPDTEAFIPILLIPVREGWLAYPNVEIREISNSISNSNSNSGAGLESSVSPGTMGQNTPIEAGRGGGAGAVIIDSSVGGGHGAGAASSSNGNNNSSSSCETDYRNVGETVRVLADYRRDGVTLSLDASGVGGGPLVLGA
ncbi:trafficking protein particle complex subunit 10 [Xylariomycetidae sp. FL2044]|nr:trafficking protein particle complex subunit 10 [Xylariomycetidae sp. FL2044]